MSQVISKSVAKFQSQGVSSLSIQDLHNCREHFLETLSTSNKSERKEINNILKELELTLLEKLTPITNEVEVNETTPQSSDNNGEKGNAISTIGALIQVGFGLYLIYLAAQLLF